MAMATADPDRFPVLLHDPRADPTELHPGGPCLHAPPNHNQFQTLRGSALHLPARLSLQPQGAPREGGAPCLRFVCDAGPKRFCLTGCGDAMINRDTLYLNPAGPPNLPVESWTDLAEGGLWVWSNRQYLLTLACTKTGRWVLPTRLVPHDFLRNTVPQLEAKLPVPQDMAVSPFHWVSPALPATSVALVHAREQQVLAFVEQTPGGTMTLRLWVDVTRVPAHVCCTVPSLEVPPPAPNLRPVPTLPPRDFADELYSRLLADVQVQEPPPGVPGSSADALVPPHLRFRDEYELYQQRRYYARLQEVPGGAAPHWVAELMVLATSMVPPCRSLGRIPLDRPPRARPYPSPCGGRPCSETLRPVEGPWLRPPRPASTTLVWSPNP